VRSVTSTAWATVNLDVVKARCEHPLPMVADEHDHPPGVPCPPCALGRRSSGEPQAVSSKPGSESLQTGEHPLHQGDVRCGVSGTDGAVDSDATRLGHVSQ
jgi:hypothetical protein